MRCRCAVCAHHAAGDGVERDERLERGLPEQRGEVRRQRVESGVHVGPAAELFERRHVLRAPLAHHEARARQVALELPTQHALRLHAHADHIVPRSSVFLRIRLRHWFHY